jgi:homoserine O-succinyltransferase
VLDEDIAKHPEITVLARSKDPTVGVYIAIANGGREVYVTGHSEYDADTLEQEYRRDVAAGKPIHVPENYYPGDDPRKLPLVSWRAHANLLFCNWLNYFVYQTTPYDLSMIPEGVSTEDC